MEGCFKERGFSECDDQAKQSSRPDSARVFNLVLVSWSWSEIVLLRSLENVIRHVLRCAEIHEINKKVS